MLTKGRREARRAAAQMRRSFILPSAATAVVTPAIKGKKPGLYAAGRTANAYGLAPGLLHFDRPGGMGVGTRVLCGATHAVACSAQPLASYQVLC